MIAVDLLVLSSDSHADIEAIPADSLHQAGLELRVHPALVVPGEHVGRLLDRLLEACDADVCAVLAPRAELLPGALAPIVATLFDTPALGAIAAAGFELERDGSVTRASVNRAVHLHTHRAARYDAVTQVSAFGEPAFCLFVFRRSALAEIGGFARHGDRDVCARAVEAVSAIAGVAVTPDLACALRRLGGNDETVIRRTRALLRSARERGLALRVNGRRLAFGVRAHATASALHLDVAALRALEQVRALRAFVGWRVVVPLRERVYDWVLTRLSHWPISWRASPPVAAAPRRIGYYLWRYPVASETFIRRELGALYRSGIDVLVIADGAHYGGEVANHDDADVPVRYLLPILPGRLRSDFFRFALRRPLATLNLFVYVVCRTYGLPKTLEEDIAIFGKALHLAAVVEEEGIEHIHAPWGDTNAFIAMVAARLARATFSLQFRAHDLHRRTSVFLIAEKVRNARFVVTNTVYNRRHLESLLDPGEHAKIRQIYNGLPVHELRAGHARQRTDGPVRVLAVARLIEPKGLVYLLEACALLRDRGLHFVCEIVGGAERPLYVNDYLEIRSTHARLRLEGCVELAGALPFAEVRKRYERADLFAIPFVKGRDGSNDIIPNAVLEAMACGLPVVTTDITALPELVTDGESGFLVPPRDTEALAARLAELIESPYLRARMGSYGRRRAEERFDVERNVAAYVELFAAS